MAEESRSLTIEPSIFEVELTAGVSQSKTLLVTNPNPYPVMVTASIIDVTKETNGRFTPVPTETVDWLTLTDHSWPVATGAQVAIPFLISLPVTTPPGDYQAAILVGTESPFVEAESGAATASYVASVVVVHVVGQPMADVAVTHWPQKTMGGLLTESLFLICLLCLLWIDKRQTVLVLLLSGILLSHSYVRAASLTSVKDTLSDSNVSALSKHTIQYTSSNAVTAGQTIKIQFDPETDLFNLSTLTQADMTVVGFTLVSTCGAAGDEATVAIDSVAPDKNVTFTVCSGDTVSAGAKTITLNGPKIVNPNVAGSYLIRLSGTQTDNGDTRVAIFNDVTVSATVPQTLTFTIEGVAAGQPNANGEAGTTSVATTSTSIPFGILAPNTVKTAQQKLNVLTNARNGFTVTLLISAFSTAGGSKINYFADGAATATPIVWRSPRVVANDENTSGHFGVTSEDADLNGDEFGTALYAGNFASARAIFANSGPADGLTANQGTTRIGFKIETTALQPENASYNATFQYIVTAVF